MILYKAKFDFVTAIHIILPQEHSSCHRDVVYSSSFSLNLVLDLLAFINVQHPLVDYDISNLHISCIALLNLCIHNTLMEFCTRHVHMYLSVCLI